MSTTTQTARYSADYIDLGSDDEACSRCEGDGCSHCHGRGLVPATSDARCYACDASPVGTRVRRPEGGRVEAACVRHAEPKSPATSAPTDEQLRAMTQTELAVEIEHARNLANVEYWRFSRSSSPRVAPGGPGTVRYGRATRERSRRIAERVAAATAPCHDCDGRGYDCERWPDGTERRDARPVACSTCEGAGTLPLSTVLLFGRAA